MCGNWGKKRAWASAAWKSAHTCWEDDSKFIRYMGREQESKPRSLCNRNQNGPQDELASNGVKFDKHHIVVAFDLKGNADLVLFGLKHGLIALDPQPQPRALES